MPAVANIVLNDAQATPVAHTFIPLGPDTEGAWWFEDQSGSTPLGYKRISVKLTRPLPGGAGARSDSSRVNRVKITIHDPVQEALGTSDSGIVPPPTLAYVSRCNIEFVLPERNSLQNRKDLRKYADFLLANAQITALVEDLQNYF